ncbi:serine protease grass-like [Drosophila biarmipes]|uniref:serine protease grass-like n=1 Tax=Drosophila biarmipes TaxID=125945 RepID=UPI001CDB43ED|nr:serine protease grass-like [Drosophila biarmipes]
MKRLKVIFAVLGCQLLATIKGSAYLLDSGCGKSDRTESYLKIGGGEDASIFANPWMASVMVLGNHACGGSLITSRFVLTAAHCISNYSMMVRLGEYKVIEPNPDCSTGVCIPKAYTEYVDKKIVHSKFDYYNQLYDIALLRMASAVQYSDYVRPICLIVKAPMENVLQFNATGWGLRENGRMSRTLQKATLHKTENHHCSQKYTKFIDHTHICTGSLTSQTCVGDSGGPLSADVFYQGELRPLLYGVVSYGSKKCSTTGFDVHTKVDQYTDWIESALSYNWSI